MPSDPSPVSRCQALACHSSAARALARSRLAESRPRRGPQSEPGSLQQARIGQPLRAGLATARDGAGQAPGEPAARSRAPRIRDPGLEALSRVKPIQHPGPSPWHRAGRRGSAAAEGRLVRAGLRAELSRISTPFLALRVLSRRGRPLRHRLDRLSITTRTAVSIQRRGEKAADLQKPTTCSNPAGGRPRLERPCQRLEAGTSWPWCWYVGSSRSRSGGPLQEPRRTGPNRPGPPSSPQRRRRARPPPTVGAYKTIRPCQPPLGQGALQS